jgi:hypothetical protein
MPEVAGEAAISSVLGQPRAHVSRHTFLGGNAFMLSLLNRHRGELGVTALPQELNSAVAATKRYLASEAARLAIVGVARSANELALEIVITNTSGHKLPTAYPSRRVWLHVVVTDETGAVVFESGAARADGSIAGNDNDADGARYEAHYDEITRADEVQIYEPIMVDRHGAVTTGLLSGVRYVKDNRLLPQGFDKATAPDDVAVRGAAAGDATFTAGGDRVRYRIALPTSTRGALTVAAELLYQSIGHRWAENLRGYRAAETERFTRYYAEAAADSAMPLARAQSAVPAP